MILRIDDVIAISGGSGGGMPPGMPPMGQIFEKAVLATKNPTYK